MMKKANSYPLVAMTLFAPAVLGACGDNSNSSDAADAGTMMADASSPTADAATSPDANPGDSNRYSFESRFESGASSVSYSGQTFRQLLIAELTNYIAGLTDQVDTTPPADDVVLAGLNLYFDFESGTSGSLVLTSTSSLSPASMQTTFDDVSSGKDIRGKLAGNDPVTDHKAWNTPGMFQGWSEGGTETDTPTELVQYWFEELDDLAFTRVAGAPLDPTGNPIEEVYVTAAGQDYRQLIQKFLLGSVTLSQGLDDYLDNDVADKGLLASNAQSSDSAYSSLEHAWDEGFGYFGASRDFLDYTDDEIAQGGGRPEYQGYHDTNTDSMIDLRSEFIFGTAANCAKRDRGSDSSAPTDFTMDGMSAFLAGRKIIAEAGETLSTEELNALIAARDSASEAWENCVAATAVHYINDTLADMATFGTADYNFLDHAKHWSELKGFALGLQFNPRSPMLTGTRFVDFHNFVGDAPVLPNDAGGQTAIDAYIADLEAARLIMKEAYGFADANLTGW